MLLQLTIILPLIGLLSYGGVETVRRTLIKRSILDIPNQRSSHSIPTPKGGGMVIATLTLLGLAVGAYVWPAVGVEGLWIYLLTGAVISAIGWWDDVRPLPAVLRLGLQIGCAVAVVWVAGYWRWLGLPAVDGLWLGRFGFLFTVIWIVGLTNAYNFMDGIDGLAGGQAFVAGLGWLMLGWLSGHTLFVVWGGLIMAAALGFVCHNWHPAKIFMGDVGSTFLGFTFAVMPLFLDEAPLLPAEPRPAIVSEISGLLSYSFLLSVVFVWPFLFDAFLTFSRRLIKGENVLEAHRTHLYQRLTRLGYRHDQIAAGYIGLSLTGYLLASAILFGAWVQPILFWGGWLTLALLLFALVTHGETRVGIRQEWFATVRNRHLLLFDLLLIGLSSYASFLLRLDAFNLGIYLPTFALFTTLLLLIVPLSFVRFKLYARFWPFASVSDIIRLVLVLLVSSLTAVAATSLLLVAAGGPSIPRMVPFIFLFVSVVLLLFPRLMLRIIGQREPADYEPPANAPRVLIVGAGYSGINLLREIQLNQRADLQVVGFVDDDSAKEDLWILGVPVLGRSADIPTLAPRYGLDEIFIAIPSAAGSTIRKLTELGQAAGVPVKIMPSMYELLNGNLSVSQLRDVKIEDLLRRESVNTDRAAVESLLAGKRVLITGGGGSIGSELCRQILQARPAQMILLGHGENSVFGIYHELRRISESLELNYEVELVPVIADTRFAKRINAIFEKHRPHVVYHAAAHKHVPLMEHNPSEAITNNVLGTRNVLDACQRVDVEHFVMISTDKAVNPTNVMGASKRAAELLVHAAAEESGRPYVAVRFGNVLGSRGSVIHTFKRQIAAGGPITVTHPDITRYFMIIPEAVQLVLQASVLGRGGEVFVLDMGEPVKIVDLARDLIELSGLRVGDDIEIAFSGLRPGEKLYEELFITAEDYTRTTHTKIFVADNAGALVPTDLEQRVDRLIAAAERDDVAAIGPRLTEVVPEYGTPVEG